MELVALFDNDVFIPLAGCGLLERVLELLNVQPGNAFRRDPLPAMLGKKLGDQYDPDVRNRARNACENYGPIDFEPDATLLQRLIDVKGIDPGEAALFAIAAEHAHVLVLTGDKRAMEALATNPLVADIRDKLHGRIVCFEAVLHELLTEESQVKIAESFKPFTPTHETCRIIFSDSKIGVDGECRRATGSYLGDLSRRCGEILYLGEWAPPADDSS